MCFFTINGISVSLPLATGRIPVRVAKDSDVFNASPTVTLADEDRPGSPQGLPKYGETATQTARWRRLRSIKSEIRKLYESGEVDWSPLLILCCPSFDCQV
ncbi:unnamed protein product [Fusarium venenatum]|uniref:Uncharacterized protein n=1 Tax=Fusarium venenatum TaxID=56646 RepID=A0A2L2T5V7_9HYPO|nr:LOW QUALITY PROTEIN: uncharacterized protein FVRRES_01750 [Fusarium venenatum]CEI65238.1 unnamed protein product [Fusarium venenatum]